MVVGATTMIEQPKASTPMQTIHSKKSNDNTGNVMNKRRQNSNDKDNSYCTVNYNNNEQMVSLCFDTVGFLVFVYESCQ